MKRFIAGVVLWAQYFVPTHVSQQLLQVFANNWINLMSAAALVLGILSAVHYHLSKIQLRRGQKYRFAYRRLAPDCPQPRLEVGAVGGVA